MVLIVRRHAPASPTSPHTTSIMATATRMASKCDSKLGFPQQRVKYVMVGNPEAVVRTSTAFYDLVHALPRRITPESPRKALADIQRC